MDRMVYGYRSIGCILYCTCVNVVRVCVYVVCVSVYVRQCVRVGVWVHPIVFVGVSLRLIICVSVCMCIQSSPCDLCPRKSSSRLIR